MLDPTLTRRDLAESLVDDCQSADRDWHPDHPLYILEHVAHLPLTAPQLAALAAARRAHDAVAAALTGLDDALVILAAALEQ